uniref:Uncharacterized protein n=1 Tax=Meloidogyne enterolobii TaxID=390850 RepID=A0A6V7VEH1_MELEN|nr:unnamed protein product [Meloidogyne enterolobii]
MQKRRRRRRSSTAEGLREEQPDSPKKRTENKGDDGANINYFRKKRKNRFHSFSLLFVNSASALKEAILWYMLMIFVGGKDGGICS